jgi:hypothetical protein
MPCGVLVDIDAKQIAKMASEKEIAELKNMTD